MSINTAFTFLDRGWPVLTDTGKIDFVSPPSCILGKQTFIRKNREVSKRVLKAYVEAIHSIKENPSGAATGGNYIPKLLEETIGAKFNVVLGYQGGADIDLAVERGEVQCRALGSAGFFSREPFYTWRKKGLVRVLVQTGNKRDARLPDVPMIHELMDQYNTLNSSRRLARAMLGAGGFGTLRAAFVKAVNSADLLAEAAKRGVEVELITGEDLEGLAKEVIAQPPEVIGSMKKLLGK